MVSHSPRSPPNALLGDGFLSKSALPGTDLDPDDETGCSGIGKYSLRYQSFLWTNELGLSSRLNVCRGTTPAGHGR